MSNSVVPAAAAAQAKQLVRNKKLIQRKGEHQAAQDEQPVVDHKSDDAQAVQAKEAGNLHSSMSDTSLSGDFTFASALSEAAAGSASLASEAQDGGSYGSDDDGGVDGTLLAVGALALVGAGAAVALGGGGKKNEAPTVSAASQAVTTAEDTAKTGIVIGATDPDGDVLTFAVTTNPTKGTVTSTAAGTYTYTPNANYNGSDSFVVTATDPDGLTVTQTVNVTVSAVNDVPTVTPATQSITTDEDTAKTGTVVGADVDGDTLTYSVATAAAKGAVVLGANGAFTYTPNADVNGTDSFVVKVDDGKGGSVNQTVNVTINAVNDAPRAAADNQTSVTTAEDTAKEIIVSYTDIEGNTPLSGAVVTGPAHGTFNQYTSIYTPAANFNGTDSITVKITDSLGASTTSTINITVTPVNDAPVFPADAVTISTNQDAAFTGQLAATDVENDALTFSLGSGAAHGTVTVNANGAYTYTPTAGYAGADSYVVKVTDAGGASDTMTVNVGVVALDPTVSIDVGSPTASTPFSPAFDASVGKVTYTDSAGIGTNVVINNFASGDKIKITDSSATAINNHYSFTTAGGGDLEITYDGGGDPSKASVILINDVLVNPGIVSDYNSAKLAVGYDFITIG